MDRIKYPRTPHLPFSPGRTSDDVGWRTCSAFEGRYVVVTEKLDGENTSIYPDGYTHARSMDSRHHPSRSWMKNYAAQIGPEIPAGWKIYGENMFAFHSILYTELPSYFMMFGVTNEANEFLSWKDTAEFAQLLGIETAPVLYEGLWDEELIRDLWTGRGRFPTFDTKAEIPEFPRDFTPCAAEGFVVRYADRFPYESFGLHCAAKFVREHHVQTSEHWLSKPVLPNKLRTDPIH